MTPDRTSLVVFNEVGSRGVALGSVTTASCIVSIVVCSINTVLFMGSEKVVDAWNRYMQQVELINNMV